MKPRELRKKVDAFDAEMLDRISNRFGLTRYVGRLLGAEWRKAPKGRLKAIRDMAYREGRKNEWKRWRSWVDEGVAEIPKRPR